MFNKSLVIAFAAIGTRASKLTSLSNDWSRGLAQLEDDKVDAIADQIGALSVDEVANAVEGLFALAQVEADNSIEWQ